MKATFNPAVAGIRGKAAQGGFTLVEIAIVLVIIGLLLGGILKGQEMITQAKIKNVVNDFNGITAAVNSYQDRYRALPGDDLGASGRWSLPAAASGNGDGQFGAVATNPYNNLSADPPSSEVNKFWWHLRLSGFVSGPTSGASAGQQPNNASNGIMGVQTSGMSFTSNIICTSNLPDKIAISVDTQMDDGSPAAGQVRATLQSAPNPLAPAATNVDTFVENGTNQYLLCKNM